MLHSSEFFSSCRPKRLSQGRALVPESSSESSEPGKSLVYSILYKCSKLEPGGVLRSPILLNCVLAAYLSAQSQLAAGLKSPQLDQMLALSVTSVGTPDSLIRPCVDCGRMTGNFCENECLAEHWLPSEHWSPGQSTPQCTRCEWKFVACHFCRRVHMATPPSWR